MIYAVWVIRGDFEIELGRRFVPGWRIKAALSLSRSVILLIKMHVLCTELQFISNPSAFVLFLRIS